MNGAPWSEPLGVLLAEWPPGEVPAPRYGGCDLHVQSRAELTLPLDQRSRAVDPDEPWCPRVGGEEIVNDEGDLVVPTLHVQELARPRGVPAPHVEVGAVELEADRSYVWLSFL